MARRIPPGDAALLRRHRWTPQAIAAVSALADRATLAAAMATALTTRSAARSAASIERAQVRVDAAGSLCWSRSQRVRSRR